MDEVPTPAEASIFSRELAAHVPLRTRRDAAEHRIARARRAIQVHRFCEDPGATVFVAGSLGRGDVGERSDLDLFLLATKSFSEAEGAHLIAALDTLNEMLGYPPFGTRRYLKVYGLGDLLRNTGSPQDDSENCFTARMLLLLESRSLANDHTFRQIRDQVLAQYFRDERGKSSYRPLFLLNDVLRYWRTLCLNYEHLRHDIGRPWWKKNISLKFSRALTVFATVAVLTVQEVRSKGDFESVCELPPLDRLALALDRLDDRSLQRRFLEFLDDYEQFLAWKEDTSIDGVAETRDFQHKVQVVADRFSNFLYSVLMHSQIPQSRRKYLVI